jgi:hypothetical protein
VSPRPQSAPRAEWTRARFLRLTAGTGAAIAGGAAIGALRGDGTPAAAPSRAQDGRILNGLLLLEYVQEAFYREAVERGGLKGELARLAATVGAQEREHVAFLAKRLGDRAESRPQTDFGDALGSPESFTKTAIELEEAALAVVIGQGGNLTRKGVQAVVRLVSVEARQVAWLRDIAGMSPAPRAADPSREAEDVIQDLRDRGFLA